MIYVLCVRLSDEARDCDMASATREQTDPLELH
jgi:hypothetical protein